MKADKNSTFRKCLDLPAELRKPAYQFYCADFQHLALTLPAQPPLARTCQLMRKEVLPLFYSSCTFYIDFQTPEASSSHSPRYRLSAESHIFLTTLAPGCMADMRKLEVEFSNTRHVLPWRYCSFKVDLNPRGELCQAGGRRPVKGVHTAKRVRVMAEELKTQVKKIFAREKRVEFTMNDVHDLGVAAERAVKRTSE